MAEGKSLWRKLAFRAELAKYTKLAKNNPCNLRLIKFVSIRGYISLRNLRNLRLISFVSFRSPSSVFCLQSSDFCLLALCLRGYVATARNSYFLAACERLTTGRDLLSLL